MKKKRYTETEELFILKTLTEFSTRKEAYASLAKALNRSETSLQKKVSMLKKVYPNHPAFNANAKKDTPISISFFTRLKNFFKNKKK